MEKRKEHLCAMQVCRFCLAKNSSLGSLYRRHPPSKKTVDLPLKILSCVSIEVFPSDRMPQYICNQCKVIMNLFYTYKQMVRQADERILKFTQNGMALEPIPWPSSLIKAYQSSSEQEIKTVLEGGATVQISTHNISDSDEEEEDENMFNVMVGGDASDDESKGDAACIKLVSDKNNEDSPKNIMKSSIKGFTTITKQIRPSEEEDKLYSCKHCPMNFTKHQHYTRHVRVKHRENIRASRANASANPNSSEQFRCEQCSDTFGSQDDLIYHSAIHATQNLTCPLCQEKFHNVDAVTAHIKSHVNGVEFMCDFCELVFTTKEKLESHLITAHEDEFNNELGQDDSSMEMDPEEDDDENSINVKDEGDHMLIEIKKPDEYMLHNTTADSEEKGENSISEESESEVTYTELSTVDTLAIIKKDLLPNVCEKRPASVTITRESSNEPVACTEQTLNTQAATVVRKNTEKAKDVQPQGADTEKKDKPLKADIRVGATNKSLQLLEKELQELKRTNVTRNEAGKPIVKPLESMRGKRPVIHTSTPKFRPSEDRRVSAIIKMPSAEKKVPERRIITKENKEPKEKEPKEVKEVKEVKVLNIKEDSDTTTTPKSVIKNGNNEKAPTEDGAVRRSTRPSKIKDYAKMIRDRSHDDDEDDTEDSDIEEEYREKTPERTPKRKTVVKGSAKMIQTTLATTPQGKVVQTTVQAGAGTPTTPTTAAVLATAPRKRGRPRKDAQKEIPAKVKKDTNEDISKAIVDESDAKETATVEEKPSVETKSNNIKENTGNETKIQTTTEQPQIPPNLLVYPMGQTLKKVPMKSLPPGVKPIPLPANARPLAARELCEMQIGKKMVKVQKIVMTKAEVEAMAKKGLVEMKDGTMVLKQGIKLPTASDPALIKSTLVGATDAIKESPKKGKSTPSRCELSDDA